MIEIGKEYNLNDDELQSRHFITFKGIFWELLKTLFYPYKIRNFFEITQKNTG